MLHDPPGAPELELRVLRGSQSVRGRFEEDLHQTLTGRLATDSAFRPWYEASFLYGSYARNTALHPIKDVDVCVLLRNVSTADSPVGVLARLRTTLERRGCAQKTSTQRRSVLIEMSGTTLDVVPVLAVGGLEAPLKIPDRPLEIWIDTHPKGHLHSATTLNRASNGRYIPLVKLVQAWYRYQLRDRCGISRPVPKGFVLEVLVAQYQDADAPSYAEAFVGFLDKLWAACGSDLLAGRFPPVPDPGLAGAPLRLSITPAEARQFGEVVAAALVAARIALADADPGSSAAAWRALFGPLFPSPPADTVTRSSAALSDEWDLAEDDLDTELTQVDLPPPARLGTVQIRADTANAKGGSLRERYPSNGKPLPKQWWLYFQVAATTVREPYEIRWIVENHGQEAAAVNQTLPRLSSTGPTAWERTRFRGCHTMVCELHQAGTVLARAEHKVNIR